MPLKWFREWRAKRKAKYGYERYQQGYDLTAGSLLRGETTPLYWESHCHGPFNEFDEFDRGCMEACDRLTQSGVIEDDR